MSLDAVPSGFSSAAAVTLLKTMRSTQSANSSFIAETGSSPFQASSKSTVSGDTMFSIIATAARTRTAASSSTQQGSQTSDQSDEDRVRDIAENDPYFQKDYTIGEAAQNYYAEENVLANSLRRSGLTQDGQTNGQIMADLQNFKGQQAADFASAFDSRTLKVIDPGTIGIDAKSTRTLLTSASGVYGETLSFSENTTAWMSYLKQNPNTVWTDDHGYKGTGGGLMFSW